MDWDGWMKGCKYGWMDACMHGWMGWWVKTSVLTKSHYSLCTIIGRKCFVQISIEDASVFLTADIHDVQVVFQSRAWITKYVDWCKDEALRLTVAPRFYCVRLVHQTACLVWLMVPRALTNWILFSAEVGSFNTKNFGVLAPQFHDKILTSIFATGQPDV